MANNPPAFPCSERRNTSSDPLATPRVIEHAGMSLRDWFAGQFAPAALAHVVHSAGDPQLDNLLPEEWAAKIAYGFADALLAQREKSS